MGHTRTPETSYLEVIKTIKAIPAIFLILTTTPNLTPNLWNLYMTEKPDYDYD